MIYVGLDLSINSTGICIADDAAKTCTFVRMTDKAFQHVRLRDKWDTALANGIGISDALTRLLMPYRMQQMHIVIESVGFGLLHKRTNSVIALLFEGSIVASTLQRLFGASVNFVEPTKHKKVFTGNGKADKLQSIRKLLQIFPSMLGVSDKLDDMADALSLLSTALPNFDNWQCKVRVL